MDNNIEKQMQETVEDVQQSTRKDMLIDAALSGKSHAMYKDLVNVVAKSLENEGMRIKHPNKFHNHSAEWITDTALIIDPEKESITNWDYDFSYFDETHPGVPDFIIKQLIKKFGHNFDKNIFSYKKSFCIYDFNDENEHRIPLEDQNVIITCKHHGDFVTTFDNHLKDPFGDCPGCHEEIDLVNMKKAWHRLKYSICKQALNKARVEAYPQKLTIEEQKDIINAVKRSLDMKKVNFLLDLIYHSLQVEHHDYLDEIAVSDASTDCQCALEDDQTYVELDY